jgi:hypothetical protein
MSSVYEDNFGFYCTGDDPEELAFFMHIKCKSIAKVCVRCNQKVRLQPQIILCATCSQALEYGAPSDPTSIVPNVLCSSRQCSWSFFHGHNHAKGIREWEKHIG